MKRLVRVLTVAAVVLALAVGALALFTQPAEAAGPCICPDIYAPVICDNGKVYPNQCVASCRHARNCVPYGDIF